MILNVKFGSVFAFIILFFNVPEVSNEQKWVKRLTKYIKKEMQVFQTVLIIGEDAEIKDNRIFNIVSKIHQEIPSQVISLSITNTRKTRMSTKLLHQSFETTFFISIVSLEKNDKNLQNVDTIQFLKQLVAKKARPKCLMIALPKNMKLSYRELFVYMWSNYFLDFTVLEIVEKRDENSGLDWKQDRIITSVNYFNPFNGIYTTEKFTEKIKLFPNKLLDLNGFEMKVGSFHFPPYAYVKRNASGYPVEVSGPDALIAKALSKRMNFKLSEVPSRKESFGSWNCNNKNKRTGFAYLLANNEIRFITNQGGTLANCERQSVISRSTGSVTTCILIPILPDKIYIISSTMKWIYFVLLVFIVRIITILLRFDNEVWSWFEILRGTLGFTVPREPSRLSERIAFVAILMAFLILSFKIFAILTETKLTKKSEITIDTLEELNRTNLTPMTIQKSVYAMRKLNDPVIQALTNKSSIVSKTQECIDMLVQGKNVACILRELTALIAIRNHTKLSKKPRMKIVKERLYSRHKFLRLEPSSPFVQQIDAIISRLIQSGLIYHWEKQFLPRERKSNQWETEELKSVSILIPLIFFITFGCSLSIIVFICEMLVKYIDNRIHGCILFFSQGSVF